MYKGFAVLYQNLDTKKINNDTFCARTELDAKRYFRECYRHGNYHILAVVEIPD